MLNNVILPYKYFYVNNKESTISNTMNWKANFKLKNSEINDTLTNTLNRIT